LAHPAPNFQQNILHICIRLGNIVIVAITTLVIGLCKRTCTIVTMICVKYTRNNADTQFLHSHIQCRDYCVWKEVLSVVNTMIDGSDNAGW